MSTFELGTQYDEVKHNLLTFINSAVKLLLLSVKNSEYP